MKGRAVIKKVDDWWIGWLIDIPGVNAQERTRDELISSLIEGSIEMLKLNEEEAENENIELIDIPI
jgi:hypothetical protein